MIQARNLDASTMSAYTRLASNVTIGHSTTDSGSTSICSVDLSPFKEGDTIALFSYYRENGNANSMTMIWLLWDDANSRAVYYGYEAGNTWGGSRSCNAVLTKTNQTRITLKARKQNDTSGVERSAVAGATIIAIKIG